MHVHGIHWIQTGPWLGLALLGIYHGLNPAMGWLLAVALGLQERRRRRVVQALLPIGLGHAISVGLILALLWGARWMLPGPLLRYVVAAVLVVYGLYLLRKPRHPRWGGMRMGFRDLVFWSFLMATAHGAGLMLAPFVFAGGEPPVAAQETVTGAPAAVESTSLAEPESVHAGHMAVTHSGAEHGSPATGGLSPLAALGVHVGTMWVAAGAVALLVYDRLGLQLLRRAWINLDWAWALALVGSGIAVALTG